MTKIMTVYGTRPEAIKMAPLVRRLAATAPFEVTVAVTGQHREMLDQVNSLFGIEPDHDLDLMHADSTLSSLASRAMAGLAPLIARGRPAAIVVQGDTTSAFVAGLAGFYAEVPVVHVEAGLRTHDLSSPFPEEGNRRLLGSISRLHLAPTAASRDNLLAERVPAADVVLTGNTVIDALHMVRQMPRDPCTVAGLDDAVASGRPLVLVTLHRRESWGRGMIRVVEALHQIACTMKDVQIVLPMHRNRRVRDAIQPRLGALPNVLLTEPLDYVDFVHVMSAARVILTDSGGVQEEAPSLGVPVLVARDTTERPEAVAAGTVHLVGTDVDRITTWLTRLIRDDDVHTLFAQAVNPYGDGKASERCVAAIAAMLGLGSRLPDFDAGRSRPLQPAT